MVLKLRKGAMFGLDARIALAIFGALSVISGAALFSAIEEAKLTSLIVEFQEIGKAWEQYYLDTGTYLESVGDIGASHMPCFRSIENLVSADNAASGWEGPYLKYETDSVNTLVHDDFTTITMFLFPDTTWGDTGDWGGSCDCPADDCKLWIHFKFMPSDTADALDEKVDGTESPDTGDIRVYKRTTDSYSVYYNYAPASNME